MAAHRNRPLLRALARSGPQPVVAFPTRESPPPALCALAPLPRSLLHPLEPAFPPRSWLRCQPAVSTGQRPAPPLSLPPLLEIKVRHSGCQVRLGAPPPPKVIIEYPEKDTGALELFISLANDIEAEFPDVVVEGNPENSNPRDGSFEVTYGSATIFSRLQSRRFPDPAEVLQGVREEHRPDPSVQPLGCK